jgi:hypothetical protein
MLSTFLNASTEDYVTLLRGSQGEVLRTLIDALYRAAAICGKSTTSLSLFVSKPDCVDYPIAVDVNDQSTGHSKAGCQVHR